MPVVELVMGTIGVMAKIKGVLEQFGRNNDECSKIYSLVDTVSSELMLLKDAPIMEDEMLRPAMECLMEALKRTETELRKCADSSAMARFFRTDDIAAKLNQLRQDISEKMLLLVLANSVGTNTLLHGIGRKMEQNFELLSEDMDKFYAAIGALILPLETKLERLEQRFKDPTTTDSARNKNTTETQKTGGLLKYSWPVLEASIASNEDIGGDHTSTVYKGELNGILVVIKEFGNAIDPDVRQRFVDELRLVLKLQHDNVIELLGHCYEYSEYLVQEGNYIRVEENGHLGLVSRYMPNQSLVRILKGNHQSVDWRTLFRIIQGIAKGIDYLHEQYVVHLDLKPETILLDADMTPKINDFGTARELVTGGDEITLDTKNIHVTKPVYMAPELSSSDKPTASTKSDVYSFGVILLETISLICATSEKGRPRGPEQWLNRTQGTELRDLFDRQLVDDESLMVATRCVLVGILCCLPDPAGRPSMKQVVDMLAGLCAEQRDSTNIPSSSSTGSLHDHGIPQTPTPAASPHPLPQDSNSTRRARDMQMAETMERRQQQYNVLTQDDIYTRLNKDTHSVRELLSISPGLAAVLLRHCQWSPERVQTAWFDNGAVFRATVGLPPSAEDVSGPKVLACSKPDCLCFDADSAAGRLTRSAGCSHYYCDECWRRYICRVAEGDEPEQCLPALRCRDPSCKVPVVRELVVAVAHDDDPDTVGMYDQFTILSYVDDSGGRIKWCHGRGCSRAVEFLGSGGNSSMDVFCECGHGFCWTCGVEPHRPVSCDEAQAWLDMNRRSPSTQAPAYEEALLELEKALMDLEELNCSWIGNMAAQLGVEVADLGFLTQAYEEIVRCRRVDRWMHAYRYYHLDRERDGGDRCQVLRLLEDATDSLQRLQDCAQHERLTLCAADVEAISEAYSASKAKVMGLTGETRQHFDKLVTAVDSDFQHYYY